MFPKRKASRLRGYDYASAGWYFVTVCAHDRRCLFGEIVEGTMLRNELAIAVETCWLETPRYFSGIALDTFVVMPNHIHGIVVLDDQEPGAMNRAPTLGKVVRSFKARCTRAWARTVREGSAASLWQRGYHEHVIRNEADLLRIREYIADNPLQWALDRENPNHTTASDVLT